MDPGQAKQEGPSDSKGPMVAVSDLATPEPEDIAVLVVPWETPNAAQLETLNYMRELQNREDLKTPMPVTSPPATDIGPADQKDAHSNRKLSGAQSASNEQGRQAITSEITSEKVIFEAHSARQTNATAPTPGPDIRTLLCQRDNTKQIGDQDVLRLFTAVSALPRQDQQGLKVSQVQQSAGSSCSDSADMQESVLPGQQAASSSFGVTDCPLQIAVSGPLKSQTQAPDTNTSSTAASQLPSDPASAVLCEVPDDTESNDANAAAFISLVPAQPSLERISRSSQAAMLTVHSSETWTGKNESIKREKPSPPPSSAGVPGHQEADGTIVARHSDAEDSTPWLPENAFSDVMSHAQNSNQEIHRQTKEGADHPAAGSAGLAPSSDSSFKKQHVENVSAISPAALLIADATSSASKSAMSDSATDSTISAAEQHTAREEETTEVSQDCHSFSSMDIAAA